MRIAHLSDLHYHVFPSCSGIFGKRLLGLANLYIKGRVSQFNAEIGEKAIASVVEQKPDLVLISGDLTALASPTEFEKARQALEPILSRFETVIVPGNHDYYTRRADRSHRIEQYFGDFIRSPAAEASASTYPTLHLYDGVAVIGMNPNRARLGSSGLLKMAELERLESLLQEPQVSERFKILLIHYPVFNRNGKVTSKFWRRLNNREKLLELFEHHPVDLVLHGHDHLRYHNRIGEASTPTTYLFNSGPAAFDRGPDYFIRASYNIYEISAGRLERVQYFDCENGDFTKSYDGPPASSP